nr:hypothetical protein Iba_chr08eCG4890 [Ipomoea batatas]
MLLMYRERYSAKANTAKRSTVQTATIALVRLEIESNEGGVRNKSYIEPSKQVLPVPPCEKGGADFDILSPYFGGLFSPSRLTRGL